MTTTTTPDNVAEPPTDPPQDVNQLPAVIHRPFRLQMKVVRVALRQVEHLLPLKMKEGTDSKGNSCFYIRCPDASEKSLDPWAAEIWLRGMLEMIAESMTDKASLISSPGDGRRWLVQPAGKKVANNPGELRLDALARLLWLVGWHLCDEWTYEGQTWRRGEIVDVDAIIGNGVVPLKRAELVSIHPSQGLVMVMHEDYPYPAKWDSMVCSDVTEG